MEDKEWYDLLAELLAEATDEEIPEILQAEVQSYFDEMEKRVNTVEEVERTNRLKNIFSGRDKRPKTLH